MSPHFSRSLRTRAALALAAILLPTGIIGSLQLADAKPQKEPVKSFFADFYPAAPFEQVLKQPDGTSFNAELSPGEVGGAFETLDTGHSVVRGADRWWRFAKGRDKEGALIPSAIKVGKGAPAGIRPRAGRSRNVFLDPQGYDRRTAMFDELRRVSHEQALKAATAGEPRIFKFPVIMLATWWDADAGQTQPTFQDGSNSAEHFEAILDGFGGNPTGTLTEFYWEDSFGQFLVEVDVHGPYVSNRSREDRCYYGGIEPGTAGGDLDLIDDVLGIGGGGALGMATEGVPQADVDVDFSQYDNDDDGFVDFVGMLHSGPDMAVTGDPCHTWSHAIQYTLGTSPVGLATGDGVQVDRLFTMPEFDNKGSKLNIGVATHEMLHALGEPDYYNTSYGSAGTGDWDIMAGGSYLGNPPGSNPSGFNPATRVFQGWVKPTIVTTDQRGYKIRPRALKPPGYDVSKPNPDLVLVPVKEISVGETDDEGHEWTEEDMYGLVENPKTGKFIIEGYYIENMSRTVNALPTHAEMSRAPYFDRKLLASGLMVWHFDYFRRSNIYNGSNNAQSDPNRPQMDPVEFDFNDNTQELQLDKGRGNPEDLLFGAATGITSGTRQLPPRFPTSAGDPQESEDFGPGPVTPVTPYDYPFTIEDNPNNYIVRVTAGGPGDCTLQLFNEDGSQATGAADSGGIGTDEVVQIVEPPPGNYFVRIGDFSACAFGEGTISYLSAAGFLPTRGAGDTWSNWSEKASGWAFTNVGPKEIDGLDHSADAGGTEDITLDIINIGTAEKDVSPGFVTGELNEGAGSGPINVGVANKLTVPVFNNGGTAVPSVAVAVHRDSATGPVVASGTVSGLGAYTRKHFDFTYNATQEGFLNLFVTVDPGGQVAEVHEGNNTQKSQLWAGPASPRVLVVDDDGALDHEASFTGALASLGIPYAVVTEHPDAATMKKFQAVLWEAGGDRNKGQLDRFDRAEVRTYLDGGGKMLLSSPRIVNALGAAVGRTTPDATVEAQNTLKQYFGAEIFVTANDLFQGPLVNNVDQEISAIGGALGNTKYTITQIPGRHVIDVMGMADYEAEGAPEQIGEPTPVMVREDPADNEYLGMQVVGDAAHKNFKTVLLGYNLMQHTHPDEYIEIVDKVMDFFGVAGNTYTVPNAEPVIYHSAVRDQVSGRKTHIRAVVLGGTAGQPVTLHFRRHGKGGYHQVAMTPGTRRGSYHAVIPERAITPDGTDYFIKAGANSTYDPPLAADESVAHAIGIALPEVANPIEVLPSTRRPPVVQPEPPAPPPTQPRPTRPPLPATGAPAAVAIGAAVLLGSAVLTRRYLRR